MRGAFLFALALLLAAPAFADGPYFEPSKPKSVKRRVATTSAVVKVLDPQPACAWSPLIPDPCECWYRRPADSGPVWAWRECQPTVEPVLEPVFIPEPVFVPEPVELLPLPAPSPEPEPFRLGLMTWGEAAFSGDSDAQAVGGRLYADGPIAGSGTRYPLRLIVDLDITSNPGEAFNLSAPATFGRSAALNVGVTCGLARATSGVQTITTALYARAGFVTSFQAQALDRYHRQVEGGFEFAVRLSTDERARLRVGYARAERAGFIGSGQIAVSGEVPIGTMGVVVGGDALVNMSRATVSPQRDVFHVFAGLDVTKLWTR